MQLFDSQASGILNTSDVSKDFKVSSVSGKTFRIMAAHKSLAPGAPKKLSVRVTLVDGTVLDTRTVDGANNVTGDKPVTITPIQGKGKAVLSKKAVTLNRWTPLTGDSLELGLKTPANVKLGAVALNEASLKALKLRVNDGTYAMASDGFRLVQKGANEYTIYFLNSVAPRPPDNSAGMVELKPSYTVKLEVWAEGTYRLDATGRPAALEGVNAKGQTVKSKPMMVNVRINIK